MECFALRKNGLSWPELGAAEMLAHFGLNGGLPSRGSKFFDLDSIWESNFATFFIDGGGSKFGVSLFSYP